MSVVDDDLSGKDKFAQVGFLLNSVGLELGSGGGKFHVDEKEEVTPVDFVKLAGFAKVLFDSENVGRNSLEEDPENGAKNNFVFGTVEVVWHKDRRDKGNYLSLLEHESRQKFFLHFNKVGQRIRKHKNHLASKENVKAATHEGE